MVSHSCLLEEQGPICNSVAAHSRLAIDRSACILTRPPVKTGFNQSLLVDWGILRCKDT